MKPNRSEADGLNALNVIFFLLRWWKPLTVVGLLAMLISGVISGLIKEKFKSEVVFFPSTTNSISKALLSDFQGSGQDILEFGQEIEAEQMLQILHSDDIRDRIVSKYGLMQHYEIDPSSKFPLTQLYREYESNISFERTEFMSVSIEVLDSDPQMAADIANDIGDFLDSMKTNVQRQRAIEGLKVVEREFLLAKERMKVLEDSLRRIRGKGIYDYAVQSRILNEEYIKNATAFANEKEKLKIFEKAYGDKDTALINTRARVRGSEAGMRAVEEQLKGLTEFGGANVALTDILELERKQLSVLQEKYENAKVDAEQSLPHKFVVNKAVKAEKKSFPVRWLIVVVSTLSALFVSIIILAFFEHFMQFREQVSGQATEA